MCGQEKGCLFRAKKCLRKVPLDCVPILEEEAHGVGFRIGLLATPVHRSAGIVTAVLPDEWLHADPDAAAFPHSDNQGLHIYAFLRGKKSRTSDTIYYALPTYLIR